MSEVTPAAAEATTAAFWSQGAETVELGGALGTRRSGTSTRTGFLHRLRPATPAELTTILHAAETWCERILLDTGAPPWVAAELVLRGWRLEHHVQLVLPRAETVATPRSVASGAVPGRVRRLADDDGPALRAMLRVDHLEEDARAGVPPRPEGRTDDAAALRQVLAAHADYRVVDDGGPVGFACGWAGETGVGIVEDVFVEPAHRRRGLATALVAAAVDAARARGAGPVVIAADPTDHPKELYRLLGFIPFAITRCAVDPGVLDPGTAD